MLTRRTRLAWFVLALSFGQVACQSNGCSQLGKTPGGYPPNERQPGALQVRATQAMFDFLNANGAALVPALLPTGSSFSIPPQCSGTTKICCTNPQVDCKLDLSFSNLKLTPTAPDVLKLEATFGLKTAMPLPVQVSLGLTANCNGAIDTTPGARPDLTLTADLRFEVDATRNTTRIVAENPTLVGLEREDLSLNAEGSDALCGLADTNAGKDLAIGLINMQFQMQIGQQLANAQCQKCTALTDCDTYATECTGGLCVDSSGSCIEALGVQGRLDLGALLASFAPNLKAMIDIFAVAGGYAVVDNGASLGMLGGARAAAHSPCVPTLEAPSVADVPMSKTYSGDAVDGAPAGYQLGIGVSKEFITRSLFGTVDSGGLCIAVGTVTQPLLSAGTLKVLIPSITDLITGGDAPLYILTRPTTAPKVVLRRGLYTDDGMGGKTLSEPLLDLQFDGFEIDFYALVAERYVRIMTVRSDLKLGLGLEVDAMGQIVPVLGDLSQAFTNLTVKNSELLAEAPTDLAAMFPTLLNIAVGQIASALKPIALPAFGGIRLVPLAVISTDPEDASEAAPRKFLGIFANLQPAMAVAKTVKTSARLVGTSVPTVDKFAVTTRGATPAPSATLELAVEGVEAAQAEWAVRIDGGVWTPYSSSPTRTLRDDRFWLVGTHQVEVKARQAGAPLTEDRTPFVVDVTITPAAGPEAPTNNFHGRETSSKGGCGSCATTGAGAPADALFGVAVLLLIAMRRQLRVLVVLVAVSLLACSGDGVTEADRLSALDVIGREHAARASDKGIFLAAYDQSVGDLAYAKVKDPKSTTPIDWLYVDGIAAGAVPSKTQKRRHGVLEEGPDVGRYPALALRRDSTPVIAYYDATNRALKVAVGPFPFKTHTVAAPMGAEDVGRYPAIVISPPDEKPAVAYLVTGIDAGGGKFTSELRLARAKVPLPKSAADWTFSKVDSFAIPCGGRCSDDKACVVPVTDSVPDPDPSTSSCVATAACDPACAAGSACIGGSCQKVTAALGGDIVEGVALWIDMVADATGKLSITYYDRSRGELRLASEIDNGFSTQSLDGDAPESDVGQWSSVGIDGMGTLHIAYVDAIDDRLLYRGVKDRVAIGDPQVIDDGVRSDGLHPVGGSARLFVEQSATAQKLYVYYQDQRDSTLVEASRDLAASAWTHKAIGTDDAGDGFAIAHVVYKDARYLTRFILDRKQTAQFGFVRILALAN